MYKLNNIYAAAGREGVSAVLFASECRPCCSHPNINGKVGLSMYHAISTTSKLHPHRPMYVVWAPGARPFPPVPRERRGNLSALPKMPLASRCFFRRPHPYLCRGRDDRPRGWGAAGEQRSSRLAALYTPSLILTLHRNRAHLLRTGGPHSGRLSWRARCAHSTGDHCYPGYVPSEVREPASEPVYHIPILI